MTVEHEHELEGLRRIGALVAQILNEMLGAAEPGMTTKELDDIGRKLLEDAGAQSAPIVTYGFPGATCISINEEVAHGIPGDRVIEDGDMLNVDVSATLGGFFGDTGASRVVGTPSEEQAALIDATREARDHAIRSLTVGSPINQIGRIFEHHAKRAGLRVIKNLCSHGIGRALHEEPAEILGIYNRFDRRKLHEGQVLTVEPFFTTGNPWAQDGGDGWTLVVDEGAISAQFEHTIVIQRGEPIILT